MKKALMIISLAVIGGSVWGQELVAPQHHVTQTIPSKNAPKIVPTPPVDGAVQKAIRSRNPLQMINPFAPREYGNGAECVYHDENDNFQNRNNHDTHPKGIRLFAWAW